MLLRPVDEPRQRAPVRLVGEGRRTWLRASHDQTIEATCPQCIEFLVVLADVGRGRLAARGFGQRKESQPPGGVAGRSREQIPELPLGCLQRSVRPVVDKAKDRKSVV